MSRDQRRAALKEIIAAYKRDGYHPDRMMSIFGFVQDMAEVLERRGNKLRASQAGALVMKTYEVTSKKYGFKGEVHCKKGCGHCCHTLVCANAIELFMMAQGIRERWNDPATGMKERAAAVTAQTRPVPQEYWALTRVPCAFLLDGACSAYESRPLTCRAYGSTSLATCLEWFERKNVVVPQPEVSQRIRVFLHAGMNAAMAHCGMDSIGYEMVHGLERALEPDAEARWLAGEPVFAGVKTESRPPPGNPRAQGHAAFDLMVEVFKAGPFGKDMPPNPWFSWPA